MFETVFNNIDNILRKDAGCGTELDYIEQTSWTLFLKYLDDYEEGQEKTTELNGKTYSPIIAREYRWSTWAAPKKPDGKIDSDKTLTGDDLKKFVDHQLFPYLAEFKTHNENVNSLKYKIGEIFTEIQNKLQSGYSLRAVIDKVDKLRFRSNQDKHEMSSLYEDKIKNMGNAGRNGGEYYTPRPLVKTIVEVVQPQLGNKVYDGAAGSAGFLCEAYDYIHKCNDSMTSTEYKKLKQRTFYGKEKKSLAYIIGIMNMILHGIEVPNIEHANTLDQNTNSIQSKDRVDVVLANPPFGGNERPQIQQNFNIRTGETAYLFLQHFMKMLRKGGRCGIVIKNTFLSNTDNASITLRKQLLAECNLHTILDLPQGVFGGTGVKTIVLFFDKGAATEKIWYYQLNPGRKLGKTAPLNENDLADFKKLQKKRVDSDNSWTVSINKINKETWDLTPNNPNTEDINEKRTPKEILVEIEALDREAAKVLTKIKKLL
jgi:type I restriction enzyme M protein